MMTPRSKILLLDIETMPGDAYVWSLWGENIPLDRLKKPSRIICWAAQWLGEKEVMFSAEWTTDPQNMFAEVHMLLSEADAVITYNGDKFDLPKLMGEFAKRGLGSPGPITSIDLYKTGRKLGYISNKLEHLSEQLGVGSKVKHEGFRMWRRVDEGDPKAQRKMERYNKQDTRLLGRVYKKLIPFIKNHPYLGMGKSDACPACQSSRIQRRGVRRTKSFIIERIHCQACGAWSDGVRSKVK